MKDNYYQPANNYERNFLMVKKFGGKIMVLILPILFVVSILCSGYRIIKEEPLFEVTIFEVVTSKLNLDIDLGGYETMIFLANILFSAFFVFCLMYIFFTSKNSDFDSNPDLGWSLMHKFSMLELAVSVVMFLVMLVSTAVFIFGDTENFKSLGEMVNLSVSDMRAYKVTIVVLFIVADILSFLAIWYVQSQTDFFKSVKQTIYESVPKSKGAHTYGVFSMVISIIFLGVAAFSTFIYYCYQDAFSGFGITLDETYVYISLISSYVRGLIPFVVAIDAFTYSSMVDESNTIGTLYNNYTVIGTAEDPNMTGRVVR